MALGFGGMFYMFSVVGGLAPGTEFSGKIGYFILALPLVKETGTGYYIRVFR
jgi:hypothetical protein